MMVARNTSWSDLVGIPWSRSTRSAYRELEKAANSELTWSAAFILSFSTTPSAVTLCAWGIPMQQWCKAEPRPTHEGDVQWIWFLSISTSLISNYFRLSRLDMRQLTCTSVRVDRRDYYISVISKLDKRVFYWNRLRFVSVWKVPYMYASVYLP